jgi:methanogenic corrinoid protein MtbC1
LDRGVVSKPKLVSSADGPGQRLVRLVRTIEAEVIPRLVLAHRAAPGCPVERASDERVPDPAQAAELAGLVLTRDADVASAYVEALRARGTPIETLFLDLLAPAARHLGDLWSADLCDFLQVTVALCRLQQILHELGPAFRGEVEHREHGRRALLVPVPGEQHSFGLFMVAEFFRRAGWDVASGPPGSIAELVRLVRGEWFAVVGLSVSSDAKLDALASSIRAIRRASRNRAIGVLAGGPVFNEHPELAALVGADATATDGRQATAQARNLLALMARR